MNRKTEVTNKKSCKNGQNHQILTGDALKNFCK